MTQYAPCPRCGQSTAKKMGFTMWGGMIGPRLLSHVRCQACGATYNGKTGGSNTTNIVVYILAVFFLAFIFVFGIVAVASAIIYYNRL